MSSIYTWTVPLALGERGGWRGAKRERRRREEERFRGDRRTASWLHYPFAEFPHFLFSLLL